MMNKEWPREGSRKREKNTSDRLRGKVGVWPRQQFHRQRGGTDYCCSACLPVGGMKNDEPLEESDTNPNTRHESYTTWYAQTLVATLACRLSRQLSFETLEQKSAKRGQYQKRVRHLFMTSGTAAQCLVQIGELPGACSPTHVFMLLCPICFSEVMYSS